MIIKSTPNTITFDCGIMPIVPEDGERQYLRKDTYPKSAVKRIRLLDNIVWVALLDGERFEVSCPCDPDDGNPDVESVGGESVEKNEELYSKLSALLG